MRLADVEGTTARVRHPLADVYEHVNEGIAAFHREVVAAGGADLLLAQTSTEMTGASMYALPADMLAPLTLVLDGGPNDRSEFVMPFGETERPDLERESDGTTQYRIAGDNVELLPAPSSGRVLRLWYSKQTQLTGPTQMVDVGLRFDDYIACCAAIDIASKDKAWDLVDRLEARKGAIVPHIRRYVKLRRGQSPKVADTWHSDDHDAFGRRGGY